MRLHTSTTSRAAPWLVVVIVLYAGSAVAQTAQPGVDLDLTSDTAEVTQQPPAGGTAQDTASARGRLWGYAFGGVGFLSDERVDVAVGFVVDRATDRTHHVGGGIEWQLSPSIGISAEGSLYVVPDVVFPALAINGSYRFRSAPPGQRALVPFLAGGLSLHGPASPGVNLGVGADYWLRGRTGLRVEVRATRGRDARDVGLDDGRQVRFVDHPWFIDVRVGVTFGRSPGAAPRTTRSGHSTDE